MAATTTGSTPPGLCSAGKAPQTRELSQPPSGFEPGPVQGSLPIQSQTDAAGHADRNTLGLPARYLVRGTDSRTDTPNKDATEWGWFTDQVAPPGMKTLVTATPWEDEGCLVFQVEARGVCVARREDNHMINGTKLLNVAGMTRGRRDAILRCETRRIVVKIGPMHLRGVWIPIERALELANKERITDLLYPLFVHDIETLPRHPSNQVEAAAERRKQEPGQLSKQHLNDGSTQLERPPIVRAITPPTPPTSIFSAVLNVGRWEGLTYTWSEQDESISQPTNPTSIDTGPERRRDTHMDMDEAFLNLQLRYRRGRSLTRGVGAAFDNDIRPVPNNQNQESQCSTSTSTATNSTASGDEEPLLTRSEQKRVLLDRLMRYFYLMFSSYPSPSLPVQTHAAYPDGTNSGGGNTAGSAQRIQQSTSYPPAAGSSRDLSRKRPAGNDHGDDEDEQDQENKKPRVEPDHQEDESLRRFACPFFKKDPCKYQGRRACPGPGWTSVHRVKEHVYRNHALPIACPRCHETFESDKMKDEHVGAEERCQRREPVVLEGIDSTQKELLRSRKKKHKDITESEKWNDMYLIVFPDSDPLLIPTPYYDHSHNSQTDSAGADPPSDEMNRYEQFLRRELPGRVRRQLEVRIDERLCPLEEGLRTELIEIVRDMQLQLFEIYKSSHTASAAASPATGATDAAVAPERSGAPASWSIEDDLQPYYAPPYFENLAQLDGFNGLLWDFSEMHGGSLFPDSGYGSLQSDKDGECSRDRESSG